MNYYVCVNDSSLYLWERFAEGLLIRLTQEEPVEAELLEEARHQPVQ